MPKSMVKAREHNLQQSINDCADCHSVCMETIIYCLEQGKEHAEAAHIRQLYGCAELCNTTANFAMLASGGTSKLAAACAEVCELTAASCDRFESDRPLMTCAEVCRKTAASVRAVAKMNVF